MVPIGSHGVGRRRHGSVAGALFVAPFALLFFAIFAGPLAYSLYLSLFEERIVGGRTFAGLANYGDALGDPRFIDSLVRMATLLVVQVPVTLLLALVLALMLDSGRVHGARWFRLGIFAPYAVPSVVAALMWGYLYGPDFGPLTQTARALGLGDLNFLGTGLILASTGNILTWSLAGFNMIVLYTALRAIPREILEAAQVDGAGAVRVALHIKLPLLRGALALCGIFSLIGAVQLFNEPAILSQLAPGAVGKSFAPNWYVYNLAFDEQRLSYAAALSFLLAGSVLLASLAVISFVRGREWTG